MIEFDAEGKTYTCPYCGKQQVYANGTNNNVTECNVDTEFNKDGIVEHNIDVYSMVCMNKKCNKLTVVAYDNLMHKQYDLIPEVVKKEYPDYIPKQIVYDYNEACDIIKRSPKASATLFRRCLQGMIRDFWKINKNNLSEAINELKKDEYKGKITEIEWEAIDGLRQMGNIGAHMEKDIDLIIDIEPGETEMLKELIEMLIDKWYIANHTANENCKKIFEIANAKKLQREHARRANE